MDAADQQEKNHSFDHVHQCLSSQYEFRDEEANEVVSSTCGASLGNGVLHAPSIDNVQ